MASKGRSSRSRRNTASRGFVNNTILECLLDGDKYGYEIIKEVKDKTDGKVVLKEPSLYSSLKRFEQKGYITSYWGDSDIGGRRHYYSLTEPGRNYYMGVKSPTIDLDDDIDDIDTSAETEQLTIENINDEIYNIENDDAEVDDSAYINNMSFNVADRMNELLSEDITPAIAEVDDIFDSPVSIEEPITPQEDSQEELLDEINSVLQENTVSDYEEITSPIPSEEYVYEHKFRNDTKQELSNGNEKYVQYDLFSDNTTHTNYVDMVEETPKEIVREKESVLANTTEQEITKEIPLIEEKEVSFFNWNEMKRQATSNKTSFSAKSSNASSFSSNQPTTKYDLNASHEEPTIIENTNTDYKTKNDLHSLFNNTISDTTPTSRIIDNIAPNRVNNKIFDNVKDRIELSDAVIGKNTSPTYNDEPEMTQVEYEVLNRKLNEKFDSIAETRTSSKKELDYKKILGDLYYNDSTPTPNNDRYVESEEEYVEEYNISNEYDSNQYEELIDNNIDDERIANAINKSKIYSYNTLQESLTNDGFKFRPYSVDMSEDDSEHFVKINKIRFVYGSIMALIMMLQIATIFIILKTNGYVYAHDTALYIISIVATVATFVAYLIPYITRKDERKSKFYNLNYHLMFGVLYMFCGLILTYAVNLIIGLNHANTISFISRLLLPAILLTNCVISPIVYKMVMDNKNIK